MEKSVTMSTGSGFPFIDDWLRQGSTVEGDRNGVPEKRRGGNLNTNTSECKTRTISREKVYSESSSNLAIYLRDSSFRPTVKWQVRKLYPYRKLLKIFSDRNEI